MKVTKPAKLLKPLDPRFYSLPLELQNAIITETVLAWLIQSHPCPKCEAAPTSPCKFMGRGTRAIAPHRERIIKLAHQGDEHIPKTSVQHIQKVLKPPSTAEMFGLWCHGNGA